MAYTQWSPSQVYSVNAVVEYLGVIYVSLQNGNLNRNPSSQTLWWATAGGGGVVDSINGLSGNVSLISSNSSITITPTGSTINLVANPLAGVTSITQNAGTAQTGAIKLLNGSGISITNTGANFTVANTGVLGVSSAGVGITVGGTAQNPTIQNTGVLSINSQTGSTTLQSSGNSLAITNPSAGVINVESKTYSSLSALSLYNSKTGFDAGGNLNNAPNVDGAGLGLTFNISTVDPNTGLELIMFNRLLVSVNSYYTTNDQNNNSYVINSYQSDGGGAAGTIGWYVFSPQRNGGDDPSTYKYLNGTKVLVKGVDYTNSSSFLYVSFSKNAGFPNSRLGWYGIAVSISPIQ